jgi:hypothetical protein
MQINDADVAELVDARDLKSLDGNVVWVRVPPPAPLAHAIHRNRSARWKHAVGAVEQSVQSR